MIKVGKFLNENWEIESKSLKDVSAYVDSVPETDQCTHLNKITRESSMQDIMSSRPRSQSTLMRGSRMRTFVVFGAIVGLLFLIYLLSDANQKWAAYQLEAEKCQQRRDSLSAQLQVTFEHKSRLDKALQEEKESHIKTKEECNTFKQNELQLREKDQVDSEKRIGSLQEKMQSLQNQNEDLHSENNKLSSKYENVLTEMKQIDSDFSTQNQQKDLKIKSLLDQVQSLTAEKTRLTSKVAELTSTLVKSLSNPKAAETLHEENKFNNAEVGANRTSPSPPSVPSTASPNSKHASSSSSSPSVIITPTARYSLIPISDGTPNHNFTFVTNKVQVALQNASHNQNQSTDQLNQAGQAANTNQLVTENQVKGLPAPKIPIKPDDAGVGNDKYIDNLAAPGDIDGQANAAVSPSQNRESNAIPPNDSNNIPLAHPAMQQFGVAKANEQNVKTIQSNDDDFNKKFEQAQSHDGQNGQNAGAVVNQEPPGAAKNVITAGKEDEQNEEYEEDGDNRNDEEADGHNNEVEAMHNERYKAFKEWNERRIDSEDDGGPVNPGNNNVAQNAADNVVAIPN